MPPDRLSADDLFGPARPSLDSITHAGHPFSVPWSHDIRPMLAGFDSRHILRPEGPWITQSPFDLSRAKLSAVVPDTRGGIASFRDGFSERSTSSTEHLSAALGITVGYPFLSASVQGEYDLFVAKNENSVQASRNSSCRVGRIIPSSPPMLSQDALNLLGECDGPNRFWQRYGDYYVCGYELGADAGACMSGSTRSDRMDESLKITVTVKVLFVEESVSHTETKHSESSSSSLSFCGYNTLEKGTHKFTSNSESVSEQVQLQATVRSCLRKVSSLESEVRVRMRNLGLEDGQRLALSRCAEICQAGLVVQLLLAPFARLNEYVANVARLQIAQLEP